MTSDDKRLEVAASLREALRLAYDLSNTGVSMRDDSTLCLLWAMLTGSDSVVRSTTSLFGELGEVVGGT